jgi:hypothetical protein
MRNLAYQDLLYKRNAERSAERKAENTNIIVY